MTTGTEFSPLDVLTADPVTRGLQDEEARLSLPGSAGVEG